MLTEKQCETYIFILCIDDSLKRKNALQVLKIFKITFQIMFVAYKSFKNSKEIRIDLKF